VKELFVAAGPTRCWAVAVGLTVCACGASDRTAASPLSFGDAGGAPATDGARIPAADAGASAVSGLTTLGSVCGVSAPVALVRDIPVQYADMAPELPGWGLAANGALFWVEGSYSEHTTIMMADLDGGHPAALAEANYVVALTTDASNVYWLDWSPSEGRVMQVSRVGGAPVVLSTRTLLGESIAVDASNVYWAEGGSMNAAYEWSPTALHQVSSVPIGGGSVLALAAGVDEMTAVVADGSHVYWTDYDGTSFEVRRSTLDDAGVTTLASMPVERQGAILAQNDASVFWTTGSGIGEVAKGGGGAATLASSSGWSPDQLVADSTDVYISNGYGSVLRVPLDGGAPATLAVESAATAPVALCADGSTVYWLSMDLTSFEGDYTLFACTKPGSTSVRAPR